jgi:cytochrome c oxidase subunit I
MSDAGAAAEVDVLAGEELEVARRLTVRYVLTAQLILAVSGVLGVLLRASQADVGRLGKNWFYALMTAHGLGAFVGWAGFSVMGVSYWVFAQVGFPLRRFGRLLAETTYWLMVVGVGGIVVSTLAMHFAGSWVFLYPLPFHSAGQWGKAATGLFLSSVLLVGLSIVTWCLAVLDTAVSPALHAVSKGWLNRFGVALGFGFLWPKRYATNPRAVPYPVIPLTVIGVDMIIATLPLAVLLVEMIVQTFVPGAHVDPLLAKNVLWWFGHPVVYLLLFPAVAVYYVLVPRYAGRPLVSGNVIAVGWTIAIVANVIVWAHHVYIDYPAGSPQAAIDTAMQPLTFALTIVSALSLYSLFFTIYKSNYTWNAAGTALFLGLVSWLSAGLSGVVNATIAFDQVVHNTLWIVGHFHQMALLNIGLVAFAAVYAWLPDWVGHPLYSERLAKQHVWGTFIFATANSVVWLIEGLEGAPRRFAVLPHNYDTLGQVGSAFAIATGVVQIPFFWNVLQTIRGKIEVPRKRSWVPRDRREAAVDAAIVLLMLALLSAAAFTGWAVGHYTASAGAKTVTVGSTTSAPGTINSNAAAGKAVFQSAGCSGCHTLKAAGATGTVGPNLDEVKPPLALVLQRVTNGKGTMPSFKTQLTAQQIREVAAFVVASTGG